MIETIINDFLVSEEPIICGIWDGTSWVYIDSNEALNRSVIEFFEDNKDLCRLINGKLIGVSFSIDPDDAFEIADKISRSNVLPEDISFLSLGKKRPERRVDVVILRDIIEDFLEFYFYYKGKVIFDSRFKIEPKY